MRLSVNLTTPTIEHTISKMRAANLQQIAQIRHGLLGVAPPRALLAIDGLHGAQAVADPTWFNVPENFQDATKDALTEQREAFVVLASKELWAAEQGGDVPARMRKAAAACANAAAHDDAIKLLQLAREREQFDLEVEARARERNARPPACLPACMQVT